MTLSIRRACLLLLLALVFTSAAHAQFTLEQALSSPFPSDLVAAPAGERVAWVFDHRGTRNIWVAEGPEFRGRPLTRYSGDDGQNITNLVFTPDGETLLYVRGTETNSAGEVGDPTSGAEQRRQQVWAITFGGGEPRLIGDMNCQGAGCEDLQVSPDGKQVVWASRRQIWEAPVAGGSAPRPLFFARGSNAQPRWSPDGTRLAFVSDRGSHRFIGIYTVGDANLRWVAPSVDRDSAPRWTPDGKSIAFIRIAGRQDSQPSIPLTPTPWSIWVGDAASGEARELWRSGAGGNDSLPPGAADFLFVTQERVVFPSEQKGRFHLYSIPLGGGAPTHLTAGQFDVEEAVLARDQRTLLYTSNQNDVDRRHIWRISLEKGNTLQMTRGDGLEWSPVETAGGAVVCLASSATSPALPYRITSQALEPLAPAELLADFPEKHLVKPRQVIFQSEDGVTVHGQLFLPAKLEGRRPAILFTHGGPMRHMMLGFHNRKYYHHLYAANQYLASRGYVVLSVNYRLGTMYGRGFRVVADGGWRGASEYRDVLAAARWLQQQEFVDAQRIGLYGGSYGGYLTALGLARDSGIFAAGVDIHGVHDWSARLRRMPPDNRPPDWDAALKLAWQSSPVADMATWRSPVLLIHGDDDRNVAFSQTTDLAQRLREQNVEFEQMVFPDEIHSFLLWRNWVRALQATADFFDKHLKR